MAKKSKNKVKTHIHHEHRGDFGARITLCIVLLVVAIIIAVVGYMSGFIWLSALASALLIIVGIKLCKGSMC